MRRRGVLALQFKVVMLCSMECGKGLLAIPPSLSRAQEPCGTLFTFFPAALWRQLLVITTSFSLHSSIVISCFDCTKLMSFRNWRAEALHIDFIMWCRLKLLYSCYERYVLFPLSHLKLFAPVIGLIKHLLAVLRTITYVRSRSPNIADIWHN